MLHSGKENIILDPESEEKIKKYHIMTHTHGLVFGARKGIMLGSRNESKNKSGKNGQRNSIS